MRRATRYALLALGLLLPPAQASAEWQIKPFLGATAGGGTTFVNLEHAAGNPKVAVGVGGVLVGEVIGIEADVGHTPGFFQSGAHLVSASSATTLTVNLVVAMPRHLTQYTLRPYIVGGTGLMHARIDDVLGALQVSSNLVAVDVGGGATGFLTERIGLSWDVRYFRGIGGTAEGLSFGPERLSFWRANMALALRPSTRGVP